MCTCKRMRVHARSLEPWVTNLAAQTDPEAAKIVFDSGIRIVLIPLEVTHTALATEAVLSQICPLGTALGRLVKDIILFFADTYQRVFNFSDPPLHDPCAVAYAADPSLFQVRFAQGVPLHGKEPCVRLCVYMCARA